MAGSQRRRRRIRGDRTEVDAAAPDPARDDVPPDPRPAHPVPDDGDPVPHPRSGGRDQNGTAHRHGRPPGDAGEDQGNDRGLRVLVGGGASQVSVAAAMRARDAARPGDADIAAAEAGLVIVRRGWVPGSELPGRAAPRPR